MIDLNSTSKSEQDQKLTSFSDRRRIREELQKQEAEGVSLDPAIKCKCHCGNVHYKPKGKPE